MVEVEKGQVAHSLIEAIDELDLSLAADDDNPSPRGSASSGKLLQKLAANGIERLALVGRPYDPNAAEAVDIELVGSPAQNDSGPGRAAPGLRPPGPGSSGRGRVKVGRNPEPAKA